MVEPTEKLQVHHLCRLLAKSLNCELILTLSRREYTLPGLEKRLGKKKGHLCVYLSELSQHGLIEKYLKNKRMRYRLQPGIRRSFRGLLRYFRKVLENLKTMGIEVDLSRL